MEKIKAQLKSIIYQNDDKSYVIAKMDNESVKDFSAVGSMPDVCSGLTYELEGDWTTHPKYGKQFAVKSYTETEPSDREAIEKYLSSGLIKGIGLVLASCIVEHFGDDTLKVLDETPERLVEVDNIGKARVKMIIKSWNEHKEIKNIMIFLKKYNIPNGLAARIYKKYGNDSIAVLREDPYKLADDLFGVGFLTADSVALSMGYDRNGVERCRSAILFTLKSEAGKNGHTYLTISQIAEMVGELTEIPRETIEAVTGVMLKGEELLCEGDCVYLPYYYRAETGIARLIANIMSKKSIFENDGLSDKDMEQLKLSTGCVYDEGQLAAIDTALKQNMLVLTGGPGTGKTTTTNGIITALKKKGKKVVLAAPTGRAAKRMTEATGMSASTIHRLLGYNGGEFKCNESNPLQGDCLVVDEASMIDLLLFYNLLKAVPTNMKVILVGDTDQLPSVGAGNVLRDIIASAVVPVCHLSTIFRQAQQSKIVTNAHLVNHGKMPDLSNAEGTDFFFIERNDAESVAQTTLKVIEKRFKDAQVLCPMKKGAAGTESLNKKIQELLNPHGASMSHGGVTFRVGDKVMQMKNNYDENVFNGDTGVISSISDDKTVGIDFGHVQVEYDSSDMDQVSLAYACTIHKSQGSEYPVVIVPICSQHYIMLQRNLLYTAITRAKKKCIIIGDTESLQMMIRKNPALKRNGNLTKALQVAVK